MSIKSLAKQVIQQEISAAAGLLNTINDNFENVLNILAKSKGRIIVAGIGKSAIIGQKMVATLNSTGSPSCFLHAAEAIHGDLGIVQKNDIVIIISKSGESAEIVNLIAHLKKNISIAIVSNAKSVLAQKANYCLLVPIDKEACYLNLAPTTSTTLQLMLCDAIAVALMKLKNIDAKLFHQYHPGGFLGKSLSKTIKEVILHNKHYTVEHTTLLKDVIIAITNSRIGAVCVLKNKTIVGIITDGDIRRCLEKKIDIHTICASDIMTKNPKQIRQDALMAEGMQLMKTYNINQLIVVNEKKQFVSMIDIHTFFQEGFV